MAAPAEALADRCTRFRCPAAPTLTYDVHTPVALMYTRCTPDRKKLPWQLLRYCPPRALSASSVVLPRPSQCAGRQAECPGSRHYGPIWGSAGSTRRPGRPRGDTRALPRSHSLHEHGAGADPPHGTQDPRKLRRAMRPLPRLLQPLHRGGNALELLLQRRDLRRDRVGALPPLERAVEALHTLHHLASVLQAAREGGRTRVCVWGGGRARLQAPAGRRPRSVVAQARTFSLTTRNISWP